MGRRIHFFFGSGSANVRYFFGFTSRIDGQGILN